MVVLCCTYDGFSKSHILLETFIEGLHKVISCVEVTSNFQSGEGAMNATGQIFGHDATFDRFNTRLKFDLEKFDKEILKHTKKWLFNLM